MRRALAVVLALGALLHAAILAQSYGQNPFAHRLFGDAEVYWDWAGEIAQGHLVGTEPFFAAPLYPYLLGGVRALGGGLLTVYVLQLALHLGTAALLARVGERRFGRGVGLAAAAVWLLLADPGRAVARVLAGGLQVFLVALVLERGDALLERAGRGRALALGLATGALALAYPPALALVPVVAVAAVLGGGLARGALVGAAAVLAIAPATLHNRAACGEWIPITAHGGVTFYHGNNPSADGTFSPLGVSSDKRTHHLDALRQTRAARGADAGWKDVSSYFFERGLAWWKAEPAHALAIAARKAWWFCAGRVYGDVYLPTFEAREPFGSRLAWAFVPVAWCTFPALVLAVLLLRRLRPHLVALALLGLPFAVCTVFWYTPRYRMPATPVLALFAAAAVARAARGRSTPERVAVGAAVLLGVTSGWIGRGLGIDRPETYRGRFELRLGDVLRAEGRTEEAVVRYRAALDAGEEEARLRLADLERIADPRAALATLERLAAANPTDLYAQRTYAVALAQAGEWARARAAFQAALAIEPEDGASLAGLGNVLLESGDAAAAIGAFEIALRWLGEASDLRFNLALAREATGDVDGAVRELRTVLANDPAHEGAASALFGVLKRAGRHEEAADVLRAALARSPGHPEVSLVLAWTLATCPDERVRSGDEAFELASAARAELGDRWDVLDTLAAAQAECGRFDEAVRTAEQAVAAGGDPGVRARLALYRRGERYREE